MTEQNVDSLIDATILHTQTVVLYNNPIYVNSSTCHCYSAHSDSNLTLPAIFPVTVTVTVSWEGWSLRYVTRHAIPPTLLNL